ncbi:hypothetical protein [Streptomyces sp. NPDC046887]|uniref:hypothetical protein n=1 Tax=Streptomyces sp. NPDC046887 TaxID=3155472 RepID=UPI0033EA7342
MTLLVHAIEVEGDTAVQSGTDMHAVMTAILLAYGADPARSDPGGRTPARMAAIYSHDRALGLLKKHGLDLGASETV